mmetsp:Transcript_10598/g.29813  ORF Transcript_10598/g.29813 Transcript_10598/m.29813 type:complete len:350 (-) Transcript_10598:80-1129(-)
MMVGSLNLDIVFQQFCLLQTPHSVCSHFGNVLHPLGGRPQLSHSALLEHLEGELRRWAAEEDLVAHWHPRKGKVFADEDELAVNKLVVDEALSGDLSLTGISRQMGGAPLLGSIGGEFNGLKSSLFSGFRGKVGLEGGLTLGNILVAGHLVGNERVAGVGHIDHFISMRAILANPETLEVELGQDAARRKGLLTVSLGLLGKSLPLGKLHALRGKLVDEFGILGTGLGDFDLERIHFRNVAGRSSIEKIDAHAFYVLSELDQLVAVGKAGHCLLFGFDAPLSFFGMRWDGMDVLKIVFDPLVGDGGRWGGASSNTRGSAVQAGATLRSSAKHVLFKGSSLSSLKVFWHT